MAAEGWWDEPVKVMLDQRGSTVQIVSNNTQAGNILIARWPTKGGAKHKAARQAVFEALKHAHDAMTTTKARMAFADAAREAHILVPDM